MRAQNPERITPAEMARALGKKNPDTIKAALWCGTYPIGMAYRAGGRWVCDIPRAAFMEFIKTGRVPEPSDYGKIRPIREA